MDDGALFGLSAAAALATGGAIYCLALLVGGAIKKEAASARIESRLSVAPHSGLGSYYGWRATRRWQNSHTRKEAVARLSHAGWSDPERIMRLALALGAGFFTLSLLAFGFLHALIVATLAAFMGLIWLNARSQARLELFAQQLPGTIRSISAGLAAGLSLPQALKNSADEAEPPAKDELLALSEQIALGLPLDEALRGLHERLPLAELNTLLLGLTIQRRSGGNMVQLLRGISQTIHEKRRLERNLRVETAHARMSAKVIGFLPIIAAAGVAVIDPSFISPLFTTGPGLIMTTAAFVLELIGFLSLRRILEIDI